MLALAACSVPASDTPAAEVSPMASSRPSEAVAELGPARSELAPGRYTREGFEPRIVLEVGEGWTAQQVAPGFFDVERNPGSLDVIAVQFGTVVGAESAADAVADIASNAGLTMSAPEMVEVGGVEGLRVVVETTDPADSDPPVFRQVLSVTAGPLSIASARRLEVTLLDVDGGVLAVLVGGSVAEWERTLRAARPVVDSVTIGP
jgi:hypothetical protein